MAQFYPFLLTLILFFGYAVAAFLVAYSLIPGHLGLRWGRIAVIPVVAAVALVGALLFGFAQESADLAASLFGGGLAAGPWRLSPWAGRAVVAIVIASALIAVYLAAHDLPQAFARSRLWGRITPRPRRAQLARIVLVGGLSVAVVSAAAVTDQFVALGRQRTVGARIVSTHRLPGGPTGMALQDGEGYITLGEGPILRVDFGDPDQAPEFETVAEGLTFPRGPAIIGDELLVVDLGNLACENPFPQCWTPEPDEELARVNASSAAVLAFRIDADGALAGPTEVLQDLPVINTEHAPGSITVGPEGFLYLPIGGPDRLVREPELLDRIDHRNADLIGTLVRFRAGDEPEVVATGMRNVFEVAFDADGRILGVDNGGETTRGWRLESLLEILPGSDYGYPEFGTFNPIAPHPLWILDARASAAIAVVDDKAVRGVLVGAYQELFFVPLQADDDGLYVPTRQVVREVLNDLGGFVTAIEPLGGSRFAVTVFDASGARNALHVIELELGGA